MKRILLSVFTVLMCLGVTPKAKAFVFYDLTPLIQMAPQFCAMCVPSAVTEVVTTYQQAYQMRDKLKAVTKFGTLTKMMQNYGLHMGKSALNNFLGKAAQGRLFSTSRTIKANSLADMDNEAAVKKAIKKLFLQYPSNKSDQIRGYSAKLTDFQVDSLVEMFVSAEDLKKKLDELMETLDKIEMCVLGGSNPENKQACSETGMEEFQCNAENGEKEDNMCFERNSLLAVQIYDKIMIYNEYLTAMLAQHQMTVSLGKRPTPLAYGETSESSENSEKSSDGKSTSEQHSFLHELNIPLKVKSVIGGKSMAFASAEFDEIDEPKGYIKALEGKENEFESLEYLERAHTYALEAVKAHNMKQQLPSYKKVLNSYKNMKKTHEKAVEKLLDAESCTLNYIGNFYKDSCLAWFGKKCAKDQYDGNIVFHYETEKSLSDKSASEGVMDVICPDDHEHLCYVESTTKVKGQKGLKAYLLALYDNAKNEDAEQEQSAYLSVDNTQADIEEFLESEEDSAQREKELSSDIYMTQQDDDEMKTVKNSTSFDKHVKAKYDKYKEQGSPSELIKPSTQEQVYAEERKDSLMNWTLGSLTSRQIIKDVVSGGKDFGTVRGVYPLWNDQKAFYDQYITGKYENIKTYFERAPKVKLLAGISNALEKFIPVDADKKDSFAKSISDLMEFDEESVSSQLNKMLEQEKAALQKLKDDHSQKIKAFAEEKVALYRQLDDHNIKLNEYRIQYNASNEVIQNAEQVGPAMEDAIEVGDDLYKDRAEDEKPTTISPQNAELSESVEDLENKLKDAKKQKEDADRNIKNMQTNIAALQKKIESLDEKIEKERSVYVRDYSDLISEYKEKMDQALLEWDGNYEKIAIVESAMKQFPVVGLAKSMIRAVQDYVIEQVNLTENEILNALHQSSQLYYPQYHDKILAMHNEMIKKITEITLSDVSEGLETLLPKELVSQKDTILEAVIGEFKNICEGDYCTTPDTDYFIGIMAKKRDLKAPKEPVNFSSAPLREVFHFDVQDYDNVDKWFDEAKLKKKEQIPSDYNDVIITGESFLDGAMGDVPEIWKYILRHRAYVEKDFDLTQLFDNVDPEKQDLIGSAEQEFIRSGIYPCFAGNQGVDATVSYADKYPFGYAHIKHSGLLDCQNVHQEGKSIWDNEVDAGQKYSAVRVGSGKNSELSQILAYVIDHRFDKIVPMKGPHGEDTEKVIESTRYKLTFSRALQRGIYVMQKLEENNGKNKAADAQYRFIQRMLPEQNQMGSYLDFLEAEQISREALDKVTIQVRELTDNLKAFYEDLGYTWSDDFDLNNEDDFEKAAEVLDQIKETQMTAASNQLSQIKGISDKIQKDTGDVLNILTVLQLDEEEMLVISGDEIQDVGDDVEFLEKIKTAEADAAIGDEYADRGNEEYEERLKHWPSPYCSSYRINLKP